MKSIVPLLGWALFLSCACYFVTGYGTRWECGRYYMPKTLVVADGQSHPDGTPIPPLVVLIAGWDIEEETTLVLLALLGGLLVYLGIAIYRFHRAAAEYRKRHGRDFNQP